MTKPQGTQTCGANERIRALKERFRLGTLEGFLKHEVIALLLSYSAPSACGAQAATLTARFKGIRGVFDADPHDIQKECGLSAASAILIRLVKELCAAYLLERVIGSDVIRSPKDALDYLAYTLSGERIEKFLAVFLNSKGEALAVETLHEGTINQTAVYPRKAIERAFKHNAAGVIFVHNHPSGDSTPSTLDRQLMATLERAAGAVDIMVHDHLIIGRNRHWSAIESGRFAPAPRGVSRQAAAKETGEG